MQTSFHWQNISSYELQRKDHIECYDNVMDLYPNYPKIWRYTLISRYKAKKEKKEILEKIK